MSDVLLILNAGSSSIKFALFPADQQPTRSDLVCEGAYEGLGHRVHFTAKDGDGNRLTDEELPETTTHEDVMAALLRWLDARFPDRELVAAGHRVVHGGMRYAGPVRIDAEVIAELTRLVPLAPLHQPHHLNAIAALAKLHPTLPQVACFDTSFHRSQPELATEYALPRNLTDEGIRRYGFHGLSYEYIASVLPEVIGEARARQRVVVAHLGSGASMCAIKDGRSVATTMGFTALDGLPMSRRCGDLDPGVVLYLMQQKGMSADAVSELLYQSSGLLGVSGVSDDMKALLASDAAACRRGGKPVRLSDRPRARIAGCRSRRPRRARVHRRDRRACRPKSAAGCARTRPGSGSQLDEVANAAGVRRSPRPPAERPHGQFRPTKT